MELTRQEVIGHCLMRRYVGGLCEEPCGVFSHGQKVGILKFRGRVEAHEEITCGTRHAPPPCYLSRLSLMGVALVKGNYERVVDGSGGINAHSGGAKDVGDGANIEANVADNAN